MDSRLQRLKRVGIGLALLGCALLALGGPAGDPAAPRSVEAAGFVVTSLADSGPGSLRQAIIDANAAPGLDVITFGVAGTIPLALPLAATDPAGVLIDGSGRSITLDGGHRTWMLYLAPGARVTVSQVAFTRNNHSAVYNNGGTLALWKSTFSHGSAGGGTAVYNTCGASTEVRDSTLSDNVADNSGGAVYNEGLLSVVGSTLHSNSAGLGGAIFNQRVLSPGCLGQVSVANSTVSANAAIRGGAIANYGGHVLLSNVTVYQNNASVTGGGLYNQGVGDVDLRNTILTRNTAPDARNCSGPVFTTTYPNLSNDLSGCSVTGTAPILSDEFLSPLADNGGPTKTHTLGLGSKALNSAELAVCAAAPVSGKDQRGVTRPFGSGCELGAVEATRAGGTHLEVLAGDPSYVSLAWEGGEAQSGYSILRHTVLSGTTSTLATLGPTATFYQDLTIVDGQGYCYLLVPTDAGLVLGSSDLFCVLSGTATAPPFNTNGQLRVSLSQSSTATITYTAAGSGADSFKLVIVPLDGSAPEIRDLPGQPPIISPPLPTTLHETGGASFCYDMIAFNNSGTSNPDIICVVPGFSTLRAAGAKAEAGGAPGGRLKPGVGPNQRQTIESVTKRMKEKLAPLAGKAGEVRQRAEAAVEKAVPGTGKRR